MATLKPYWVFMLYLIQLTAFEFFKMCQRVWWKLSGVQKHINKCYHDDQYDMSVQCLRVWGKCKPSPLTIPQLHHFLTTHVKFVNPEYALGKHVTLLAVNDKDAIFGVFSPQEDIYNVRKWPFLYIAEFQTAEHILVMPMTSFIRLANKLGDPRSKVIWVHSTGRCGSTALAQAFNSLPDVLAMAEPMCFFSLKQKLFEKEV
ncbi:hypothetical protein EB796_006160 [Bugula neritina]|uniref:Uncharacterized protein n=1 Tax=Bugula neritina TaxID=10212 RepID=A0A7J7KB82_BUGNE|nr:hypothetical protein EB796_006160 [Bugula neritina]